MAALPDERSRAPPCHPQIDSEAGLETTLLNYSKLYNHPVSQRAIDSNTSILAFKEWQKAGPQQFVKWIYDQAGLDILDLLGDLQCGRGCGWTREHTLPIAPRAMNGRIAESSNRVAHHSLCTQQRSVTATDTILRSSIARTRRTWLAMVSWSNVLSKIFARS